MNDLKSAFKNFSAYVANMTASQVMMLFGLAAGTWIIRGQRWRSLAHDARQRLGLAYLAVGWAGLFGLTMDSSVVSLVIIAPGIMVTIAFAASMAESRQQKRDESDNFP